MKKMPYFWLLCCWLTLFSATPGHALGKEQETVTVAAAASLKEVVGELADSFARSNPAVRIVRNFGASGTLAKQIESGAPADLFIGASSEWVDYLKGKRLAEPATEGIFAYNTLVFAGTRRAAGLDDLLHFGRIAIGSPKSVPAGEYAMAALKKAGLDRQLAAKLVMARDVREALVYAERGEVDGAFVYRTDALQARQAKIQFTVPPELYPRVTYPLILTGKGAANAAALKFRAFLGSAEAKAILQRHGFLISTGR